MELSVVFDTVGLDKELSITMPDIELMQKSLDLRDDPTIEAVCHKSFRELLPE